MSTATTTRVRLNDGKYGTVKKLFTGDGVAAKPAIQVGDKDVRDVLKEAKKAHFKKMVEVGRALMLEATFAIAHKDEAAALRAMRKNRYACACYLTLEAGKRERRYVPVDAGFRELELMEDFLADKIREKGQEVPK